MAFCVALWCVALALGPQFVGMESQVTRTALIVWPYLPALLFYGTRAFATPFRRTRPKMVLLVMAFCLALVANVSNSIDPATSWRFAVLTLVSFHLTSLLWCVGENTVATGIRIASIAILLFYLLPSLEVHGSGARLAYGRNPNSIGLIVMFSAVSMFLWKSHAMKFAIAVTSLGVILVTGSRSALLGTVLGLGAVLLLELKNRIASVVLAMALVGVVTINFGEALADAAWGPLNKAMALDDRYRGLKSGFTGRIDAWRSAYEIWQDYPLLGCGYRTHEQLFTGMASSSSHNGYLAILAEIGLLGAIPAFSIVGIGICRLMKQHDTGLLRTALALSIGYCFVAAFERYYFNLGNQTSLMFMFSSVAPALLGVPKTEGAEQAVPSNLIQNRQPGSCRRTPHA